MFQPQAQALGGGRVMALTISQSSTAGRAGAVHLARAALHSARLIRCGAPLSAHPVSIELSMRYFVTLDGQEFSFALSGPPNAGQAALIPARGGAEALRAEVVSRGGAYRGTLVLVDGQVFHVRTDASRTGSNGAGAQRAGARINGRAVQAAIETELERRARPSTAGAQSQSARVSAPMPGRVVKVNVRAGERVMAGAALLSIEAMKMENELSAPCAGVIVRVTVQAGVTVEADQELISIEPG